LEFLPLELNMKDEDRLAELLALAQKQEAYRSSGRRLSAATAGHERDISAVTRTLKSQDASQDIKQEMLSYSYGL
jgi:hypothetical protein